ncbi:MAG: hypothetical protein ABEL04_04895 [Salinibacter sp.]|uniref:hypothetical protein n=1 Tax=Salinibacter sp. TaxID=2065818 RepID=UPI0035D4C655
MLDPLEQWICDTCGEVIDGKENGYTIWKQDDDRRLHSFKIVHHPDCLQDDHLLSTSLARMTGMLGMTKLLSYLSLGPYHNGEGGERKPRDFDEFVDFFRRLQVPYYEEARLYYDQEEALHMMGGANEYAPYLPRKMRRLIEKVGSEY